VNNAKVKIGESVVVYGAGGVGLNIVQAAALAGAHPVIAVDLHDNKLKLAKSMGATHLINAAKTDAQQAVLEIAGPAGVDVFVDNTGVPAVIELGYQITKPQGRVTLVGVPRKDQNISIHSLPLHFGKEIKGSHGGEAKPHEDIPRYHSMYRSGRIKLKELVTDSFPARRDQYRDPKDARRHARGKMPHSHGWRLGVDGIPSMFKLRRARGRNARRF
jgi:S-(hydroxymethyl)glutathione dehydrogenase/alcohol dehydrogenase